MKQHVEAGLAAKQAGDLETAVREFQRVADLAPGLAAAHVNLGAVYCDRKDYAHALDPLRKAIEINPDLPGAHELLGVALLAQGYAAESIPHLEKAQADQLLGVALLESGREREAVDKLETALQKHAGDPDILYYLGVAHARLSRRTFELLTAQNPGSARARQFLGEAAAASGNRDAAEKHFRAALELRQDLRGVHLALGDLYLGSGSYEAAEREFLEEVRLSPGSAAATFKLGLVKLNRGDISGAVKTLQRADSLLPGMPETLLELGKATALSGDLKAAEKALLQVLAQEGSSKLAESAHYQLAQVYRKLGRTEDADREAKRFEELRQKPQ